MADEPRRRPRGRRRRRANRVITYEETLKRNSIERIKQEKQPVDVLDDIPALMQLAYEDIPEDDILRLQWWGLYHDKPKVGHFMLRVKLPGGILTPGQARVIAQISQDFGRNYGEITTRQDYQFHWLRLEDVPAIFQRLDEAGITTAGACGDCLRNVTGCPVAGIDPAQPFDPTPDIQRISAFFSGNREYMDLPRKYKFTISACPYHCNMPEIHDVGLVGLVQDGVEGYAVWVGGGLSTFPRLADPLGLFVPRARVLEVLRTLTDLWRTDWRYRRSRAKARFKFWVEDDGPVKVRQALEAALDEPLPALAAEPAPVGRTAHMEILAQRQDGLRAIGFPVFPGILRGHQLAAIADVLDRFAGADLRFTREQNFILTGIPAAEVERVVAELKEVGLDREVNPVQATSIGCTGLPYCNYAVGETKPRISELLYDLEETFGAAVGDLHLHLDGCPHACGKHWVGDLGFQATTFTRDDGEKVAAYDIFIGGGLGPEAAIGKPLLRRVESDALNGYTRRLIGTWLEERQDGETIQSFFRGKDEDEIVAIATGSADGNLQGA